MTVPKMAAILDDVTTPTPRPAAWQPIKLSTKGETFSKYCNLTKTQGGVHQSPPLVPRWGCDFACTSVGIGQLHLAFLQSNPRKKRSLYAR